MENNTKLLNQAPVLPVPDYHARVLGYATIAATLIAGFYLQHFSQYMLGTILFCVAYPHIIHLISRPLRKKHPYQMRVALIHVDAILSGIVLAMIDFSVTPSLLLLIMINSSFIIVGSMTAWAFCQFSLAIGIAIGVLLFGFNLAEHTPFLVSLVCAIGVGIHLSVTAYYSHRQARDLMRIKTRFQFQEEKYRKLSRKLSKYLSPQVWESIFKGKEVKLETQRKKLVVFFSDIKGFTSLSEQMEAEALTEILNNYLDEMSTIALKYGGTIDKFVGDAIMIFFGDPKSQGTKKDALACASMAIEMRKKMKVLRQQWRQKGIQTPLEIRMGINTGYCTVGNFGAQNRMDYTIIGQEVNLASRLESAANAGEILLSYETYSLINDTIMCRDKGQLEVKGFSRPVPIYQLVDFRRDLGATKSFVEHEMDGFSMYMDADRIKSYDKDRVAAALEKAAKEVRSKTIS